MMSYEESYAKTFPFDKLVRGMLALEMIEDTVKIVSEAIKDKIQVNFSEGPTIQYLSTPP